MPKNTHFLREKAVKSLHHSSIGLRRLKAPPTALRTVTPAY